MSTSTFSKKHDTIQPYQHDAWKNKRRVLRFLLKRVGFPLWVRIDSIEGMENIPTKGPLIFMINHISFVDSLIVLQTSPRDIVPMAKIEVYEYPVIGIFPKLWGVIPVRREEVDRSAIRQALNVLKNGESILLAPEGTRSPALQTGKEGVAYLAARSGATVMPVAIDGTMGLPAFRTSPRWKESGARVVFGNPFRYKTEFIHARGQQLRQMTDEAMYQLAASLPEERRGVYANFDNATQNTIEGLWESPGSSPDLGV